MNTDKRLKSLELLIQKYEEVFNIVIEDQKNKYEVLPDEIFITLMLFRKIN